MNRLDKFLLSLAATDKDTNVGYSGFIRMGLRTVECLTSLISAVLMAVLIVILCFCNFDRDILDKLLFVIIFLGCAINLIICVYLDNRTERLLKELDKANSKLDFTKKFKD